MILLDTDIMIDLLRSYEPALQWLASSSEDISLPGFVVMELIQGSRNKDEQSTIESTLREFPVIWPSTEMCDKALTIFTQYYLSNGLGIIDSMIGQIACDLNVTLYTFNRKHYDCIPGITIQEPYKKL